MTTPFNHILSTRPAGYSRLLSKRRAWFTEGEGGEGENGDTEGDKSQQKPTFTHTQEDVNKAAGQARADGRKTALTELLKELGFEKADDLKATIKAKRESDESQKTEAQKLADAKAQAEKERDEAKTALTTFQQQVEAEKRTTLRDSAITKALTTANAKAEKVFALLQVQHVADVTAVLKEDGTVDEAKVKALVDVARRAYPEDFGKGGVGSPSNAGGRVPSPTKDGEKRVARINQSTIRG